jgi:hypothetical protein
MQLPGTTYLTFLLILPVRYLERDAPPPPPSQEPEAVLDRIQAWLLPPGGARDTRTHRRLARMLVALMEHPERSTAQLQVAAGLGWRAGTRMALALFERGLTHRERRGRYFYHRLTRTAEDALLLVVAGPAVSPPETPAAAVSS